MSGVWIVSMVLQWLVIVVLCLLTLSLVRQLGVLTLRINSMGSIGVGEGPAIYTMIPRHPIRLLNGGTFQLGGETGKPSLVVFFSPGCGPCAGMDLDIYDFVNKYPQEDVSVLLVLLTEKSSAEKYLLHRRTEPGLPEFALEGVPVAAREEFPEQYMPMVGGPFAFALSAEGVVSARGKAKTAKDFEQMVYAARNIADPGTPGALRSHPWGESAPYWVLDGGPDASASVQAGVAESDARSTNREGSK